MKEKYHAIGTAIAINWRIAKLIKKRSGNLVSKHLPIKARRVKVMFKRRQIGQEIAFGRIPAYCKYELYMERYRSAAMLIDELLPESDWKNLSILDVGSGQGRMTYFLNDRPVQWHGIEVLDEMIEICQKLGYTMYAHDIQNAPLPFENERFDVVMALHVLEHIDAPENVCDDFLRVLKPGGLLVIGVPVKPPGLSSAINRFYKWRHAVKQESGRTCNAFSAGSLKQFIVQHFGSRSQLEDLRGFRLLSARKRLPLENYKWFWRLNTWWGQTFSWLSPEVNAIIRKAG